MIRSNSAGMEPTATQLSDFSRTQLDKDQLKPGSNTKFDVEYDKFQCKTDVEKPRLVYFANVGPIKDAET